MTMGSAACLRRWSRSGRCSARHDRAVEWLRIWIDLGRAPRTIDAYARGLAEYLQVCEREGIDPLTATRAPGGGVRAGVDVAAESARRQRGGVGLGVGAGERDPAAASGAGSTVLRLPGRGGRAGVESCWPGPLYAWRRSGGRAGPLVPRMVKLPWIPSEAEWLRLLGVVADEPIRNRVMLALAYDGALRREELCSLRSDDLDPAHRTLRVRAETTKTRRERVVPYSAPTGVLLSEYLQHRATLSRARGGLFLSESRRNHAEPVTLWTWSKVVRRIALAANLPRFSTHTTRHLCLTDLARMGWELHAIATFAGHRSTDSTLQYIHLSGRDLSAKLNSSMAQIHAWRIGMLTGPGVGQDAPA